jgi:hypothetical protein
VEIGKEGKEKKGVTVSCQVCVEREEGDKSWSVSQPATTFIFKAMCTVPDVLNNLEGR